jgi:hypothetical protein
VGHFGLRITELGSRSMAKPHPEDIEDDERQ